MHSVLRSSILALLSAGALLTTPLAFAQTPWQIDHPGRTQILTRADHLDQRIAYKQSIGVIRPRRAAALQRQVARVRWEQNTMASRNGGHLVRPQWQVLNRKEDAISREIGQ